MRAVVVARTVGCARSVEILAEHQATGLLGSQLLLELQRAQASDGRIAYAFVSADYTQRAEPNEVLAVLQRLRARSP